MMSNPIEKIKYPQLAYWREGLFGVSSLKWFKLRNMFQEQAPMSLMLKQLHKMSHPDTQITSELQAKAAAKSIWKNVSKPETRYRRRGPS